MRLGLTLMLAACSLGVGASAWAFTWGPADTSSSPTSTDMLSPPSPPPSPSADMQKIAVLETQFAAGQFDAVLDGARALLRTCRDEEAKTGALRLTADALRKKGDWKQAATAYQRLRDRFSKGSDQHAKYEGIVEVFKTAPAGIYLPPGSAAATVAVGGGRAISDDAALDEALNHVAELRLERLRPRLAAMKQARTPQEVMAIMTLLADELRQIHMISAAAALDPQRGSCQTAGARLAELKKTIGAVMVAKKAEFDQAIAAKRFTAAQRKDLDSCVAQCKEMAKAEEAFQVAMDKLPAAANWVEGKPLRDESSARQAEYTNLASGFVLPAPSHTYSPW